MIAEVFGRDAKIATAVFKAESGLRCNAVGDGHLRFGDTLYGASYGVAQIRKLSPTDGRPSVDQLLDCRTNIEFARKMQLAQGFKPWSVFTSGRYLQYLE